MIWGSIELSMIYPRLWLLVCCNHANDDGEVKCDWWWSNTFLFCSWVFRFGQKMFDITCCFWLRELLLLFKKTVSCLSVVCQLFVSCLSVVCQLFSRRVHVAALVPSPLSPLGPKDNRLVKSFSHVTVSDWDHFESVHWQLMFNSWFWQLFFWWYGSNCTCSGSAVTGSSCSGQRWSLRVWNQGYY